MAETTTPVVKFDREKFKKEVALTSIIIEARECGNILPKVKSQILAYSSIKNVLPVPGEKTKKRVLFNETVKSIDDITDEEAKARINELLAKKEAAVEPYTVTLDWTHVSLDEILKEILPKDIGDIPSSFETVGHIAHLNLRDSALPYKNVIGEVFIAKNPRIRTVVNKTSTIETEFRTFPMEVIAGEDNLNAEVHEGQCTFQFNFADVYWNSRLQNEHGRLVKLFKKSDIVCDMFAGVGPFALPAAKQIGCVTYANDLNPNSYKSLVHNIKLNKIKAGLVYPYNMDGRAFVRHLVKENIKFTRVVMNLPGEAVEFLDVFGDLIREGWRDTPLIHCYSFSRALDDPLADLLERAKKALGEGVRVETVDIYDVRNVAPQKRMYCLTIRVHPEESAAEPEAKKLKVESEN